MTIQEVPLAEKIEYAVSVTGMRVARMCGVIGTFSSGAFATLLLVNRSAVGAMAVPVAALALMLGAVSWWAHDGFYKIHRERRDAILQKWEARRAQAADLSPVIASVPSARKRLGASFDEIKTAPTVTPIFPVGLVRPKGPPTRRILSR